MSKKASTRELVAVRVGVEQRWAYARRLEHLSYRDMRRAANDPVEDGGLGYDLSEQALKGLVRGHLEAMREVLAVDREEMIARELHDLDQQQRRAGIVAELAARAMHLAALEDEFDDKSARVLLDADAKAAQLGLSRRKLLGLDAPTEAKLEVTTRDGVLDDLNAALARLGEQPVTTTPER